MRKKAKGRKKVVKAVRKPLTRQEASAAVKLTLHRKKVIAAKKELNKEVKDSLKKFFEAIKL